MSLSNTMLQFDNWGEDFRYSGDKIVYAWSGQKDYFTYRNRLQDFVWMKVPNGNRSAITANFKKNNREYNNRQIFGVDDASTFYDTVLEANGMVTILDNTPELTPGGFQRFNNKLKVGVNPNHVTESYQVINEYFDPLAAPGTPFNDFAQFGLYSALEVQFSSVGNGRLLRITTPAFYGPSNSWAYRSPVSQRSIYPGAIRLGNFEFLVTSPLLWATLSESVFLLVPECCA